ncbi:SID1 transmembrane family member 1-like isoform X1 [Ostrinia furnacalis]|uniref:SID1 transmembrane family member 1-like isoform X1 n=1 Tax=Ostrinia furnacalis TaxID=93504 RepID=UPI00103FD519|nr:SID1 transmembrane family member 1-like isoform X1 [Ostrinia furnacalis]
MYCVLIFLAALSSLAQCSDTGIVSANNETKRIFVYNTYKYNSTIHIVVNDTTEQFLDFYEDSDTWHGYPTRVHVSSNDTISGEYPLFITATQQKGVSSWELPLVVATKTARLQFNDVSRTLCPHDAGPNITSVNRPFLQITTSSPQNVSATIKVRRVRDFYVEVGKDVELLVKPSTPKYYYFSFDSSPQNVSVGGRKEMLPRFNYTIPKSVILIIESDDEICATISIQNNSCPVFDNERDVLYQGYHLTMTTKGGITLTQSMFPQGFYIVFIVRENDEACTGDAVAQNYLENRTKNFRFRVIATISYKEYVIGAAATFALTLLVAALVALLPLTCNCRATEEVVVLNDPGPSTSRDPPVAAPAPIQDDDQDDGIYLSDSITDSIPELPVWAALRQPLTLAGLSRSTPSAHSARSNRYFWSSLTVAVVYALPVVQLLFTYQHMVFQTGDQDLCYYNFLCAHPVGSLSDFNHVYSNVGYVVLGLIFMAQVHRRRGLPQHLGIPQHPGLLYSMALALAMEGLLSACYHLCPNKMNFQFDSSFMYVIAVLCMVKIYQSRHPDVNARAHATFMLLALVMALGLFGIMYPSVYFWTFFTILHLTTCLVLTLKIYYVGQFKLELRVFPRGWGLLREHGRYALKPNYTARAVLLALANVANWALAVYGLYEHNKDFARHVLAILMGNTFLYTIFYVCMKLVHREKLYAHTWAYLVATFACWALAVVFFLDSRTKWSQTPAMSRRHNAVCSALQFYDSHDVWHFASAAAMFLYFNMLLTVDDALRDTPRTEIPVF